MVSERQPLWKIAADQWVQDLIAYQDDRIRNIERQARRKRVEEDLEAMMDEDHTFLRLLVSEWSEKLQ